MTGHVAQAFLDDADRAYKLEAARPAPQPDGHLVFEARNSQRKVRWEWNRTRSFPCINRPEGSSVETWVDRSEVSLRFTAFRSRLVFADGCFGAHLRLHAALAQPIRNANVCALGRMCRGHGGGRSRSPWSRAGVHRRARDLTKGPGPAARPDPCTDAPLSRAHLTNVVRAFRPPDPAAEEPAGASLDGRSGAGRAELQRAKIHWVWATSGRSLRDQGGPISGPIAGINSDARSGVWLQ